MTNGAQDKDMIAGLTTDEHRALKQRLRSLPETMPPRVVWERISEQAKAEGLIHTQPGARRQWYVGGGIAASIALAMLLLVPMENTQDSAVIASRTVPSAVPTNAHSVNALQALMVQSRQLEENLRELPAKPRVKRAGTAATITEVQDRIAAIDHQLGGRDVGLTPEQEQALWEDRVRLMKTLVGLRYAQTQRMAL